jgi:hypothetical protein
MLDPALRRYVEAPDAAEAERLLTGILQERAVPLIRRIVGTKLQSHGGARHSEAAEIDDLTGEAVLQLVSRLRTLREDPSAVPIQSLDDYTATLAFNVYGQYLRRRYPARARLKDRVRYAIEHDPRLALWMDEHGEQVCGYSEWRARQVPRVSASTIARLDADRSAWQPSTGGPADRGSLVRMLEAFLSAAAAPVEFDRLVTILATQLGDEAVAEPLSAPIESIPDRTIDHDRAIDARRLALSLWQEILQLPVRQRIALLLNLRDADGSGILWLFPVTGVASIRKIAAALEFNDMELAELWNRLPLDDLTIAGRLGCTRQQVINLRNSARKRLSHRVADLRRPGGGPAGNLRAVSASMEGDS